MKTIRSYCLLVIVAIAAAAPAFAQTDASIHIRGTIATVHGPEIAIVTPSGDRRIVMLADNARIVSLHHADLDSIEAGSYVGIAAIPDRTGLLTALEVTAFPPAMAGTNEGHFEWDLGAQSTMTNASIVQVVEGIDGRTLSLSYDGGRQTIHVPEGTPVVRPGPGSRDLLVPGAHVFAVATPDDDGGLTGRRIVVGVDGLVPPM